MMQRQVGVRAVLLHHATNKRWGNPPVTLGYRHWTKTPYQGNRMKLFFP
uniref:Uncharacterized protein n=1 Tax=Candidatus Kentrum sp. LPFa TaxID=2126335 RepID=A0A450WNR8_9GAMM|nr:MAG: hypothetical protein BECKLPF1236B_GA0070989_11481 [Candidatus Kentron sp. LPFa]